MNLDAVNEYLARIRAAKTADLKPCSLVTDAYLPMPPSNVGVAHLMLRPRMVLGDPTGAGKTPMVLVAYAYHKEKNPRLKMLVETTQAAQFQWIRNVEKFLRGVTARVIGYERTASGGFEALGPGGRAQQWPALMQTDVWVTTYALAAKENLNLLSGLDQFIFVPDEAHNVRSHTGEVLYPNALRLSQKARGAWGLTATAMYNDKIAELYAIMELVRPGTLGDFKTFQKTFYNRILIKPSQFKKQKPKPKQRAFYKMIGYQNVGLLQTLIDPFFLKRPFAEFQQYMPPVTFQQLDVPLDPRQRDLYKTFKDRHWPVSMTPIQQLASLTYAQMAVDMPSVLGYPSIPSAKALELVRLLTEDFSDRKVLVYSKFEKVVSALSALLEKERITHGVISGRVAATKRADVQQAFQADDGTMRCVLVTAAGASALDLQAASVVICYDLPWSWGEFQQIIGRARRIGSKHANVLVVMLCGQNTIDTKIAVRLAKKEDTIDQILGVDGTRLNDRDVAKAHALWKTAAQQNPAVADELDLPMVGADDIADLFKDLAA